MKTASTRRRALLARSLAGAAALGLGAGTARAEPAGTRASAYKAAFQVSDADPQKWNLTLNNARNALTELGQGTVLQIVVLGPGIGMLKAGSEVQARVLETLGHGIAVLACQNTMRGQHLEARDMIAGIGYVPSGVAELIRRQADGYAYLRS